MFYFFQVKIVAMNENATLRSALDKNLKSALTAAFLMLPESFSEEDLFLEIAGLSYSGSYGACSLLHPGLGTVFVLNLIIYCSNSLVCLHTSKVSTMSL
jgi:hypothetical protein